jgi:hypothetical protein
MRAQTMILFDFGRLYAPSLHVATGRTRRIEISEEQKGADIVDKIGDCVDLGDVDERMLQIWRCFCRAQRRLCGFGHATAGIADLSLAIFANSEPSRGAGIRLWRQTVRASAVGPAA